MTHLDNGGEVGLGWPELGRVGMGLVVVVGLIIPPSRPENQAGGGMSSRNEGSLNPMLCPPLLAPSCPLCLVAGQGASLPSPPVWFGQSPRTSVACSRSLPPCC